MPGFKHTESCLIPREKSDQNTPCFSSTSASINFEKAKNDYFSFDKVTGEFKPNIKLGQSHRSVQTDTTSQEMATADYYLTQTIKWIQDLKKSQPEVSSSWERMLG